MLMVEFQGASKVYGRAAGGRVTALVDASLEVKPGELVVVSGPSGAGKSTLLRLVYGEVPPTRGTVRVDGLDVGRLRRRGIARLRRELGIVPQDRRLLPDRTAFGNVALVLRALGVSRTELRIRALEALDEVDLADRRQALPRELGEAGRLRLCLARALATEPRLLIVDEPMAALDEPAGREVLALVRARNQAGTTVLVASQAVDLAGRLGGRSLTLDQGRLRLEGGRD